ncbi:rRNA N(6)-adenosine-methyltransferase METTL5-like [Convolutriloba macropyga]|uniref:rRNA N(6)-adenosine-methyltransferase METTL5-like n=1 Tax=Convolutriloba macropyga TaxID=536237 RepID=UPI003F523EAF
MKLKELQGLLQQIEDFQRPKIYLEQYMTPPELASQMVNSAVQFADLSSGCSVLDLGCGTGMLGIASVLCGADYVLGIDIDPEAIDVAWENSLEILEEPRFDVLLADINCTEIFCHMRSMFDVAVINPPFGTKTMHTDMKFLEVAAKVFACKTIYSFHKSATREHVLKAGKALGYSRCEVVAKFRFPIYQKMRGHTKSCVDVDVDLFRFSCDVA